MITSTGTPPQFSFSILTSLGTRMLLVRRCSSARRAPYEAELINANLTSAINSLKMKVPNRVFHEWCNILIQCQSDRSMKNTLPTIAQKFSDVRVVQSELEAMMQGPRREAITMMFLVVANVPLL